MDYKKKYLKYKLKYLNTKKILGGAWSFTSKSPPRIGSALEALEALEGSPSKKRTVSAEKVKKSEKTDEVEALEEEKLIALDFDQTISVKVPPLTWHQTWLIAKQYMMGVVDEDFIINKIFGGKERKEEFENALQQQKNKKNNIIILTSNESATAKACLQAAGLDKLIGKIYGCGDWSISKGNALEEIRVNNFGSRIDLENIILFDDDRTNCESVTEPMKCHFVEGEEGMQEDDFEVLANF